MNLENRLRIADLLTRRLPGGGPLQPYQTEILKANPLLHKQHLNQLRDRIIVKSRQIGISTILAIEAALDAFSIPNYNIVFLSKSDEDAKALLDQTRNILVELQQLNNYLSGSLPSTDGRQSIFGDKDNKSEIKLINGSRLVSRSSSPKSARSLRADHLIFDEFAHHPEPEEAWVAAIPTTGKGRKSRITVCSTPNGKKNYFYNLWKMTGHFEKFSLPYEVCPWLDIERIKSLMGDEFNIPGKFEQEYECSFESFEGSLWTWSELEGYVTKDVPKGGLTVLGYDPANVHAKSAVVLVRLLKGKKTVIPLADLKNYPWHIQAEKVKQYVKDFEVSKVVYDKGGPVGNTVTDNLKHLGSRLVGVTFSKDFKRKTATSIKASCQKQQFAIVETEYTQMLLRDMSLYDLNRSGFVQSKTEGHQDFLAALMLAWTEIGRSVTFRDLNWNIRGYLAPVGSQ